MKPLVVLVGMFSIAGTSAEGAAQPAGPGAQPPMQPQPMQPQPYYPPQPMQPPYYPPPPGYPGQPGEYAGPPLLSPAEQVLLAEGEISSGQIVGGALMSIWVGMGIGQAIEGRWSDTGWIFTVGEPVTFAMILSGALQACDHDDCDGSGNGLLLAGVVGYLGLRTWGLIDIFTGPQEHNRKVRELRLRSGHLGYHGRVTPFVLPAQAGDGATAGLTLRF